MSDILILISVALAFVAFALVLRKISTKKLNNKNNTSGRGGGGSTTPIEKSPNNDKNQRLKAEDII
jgi:hypothetical protein